MIGCATPPPKPISREERARAEQAIGIELSRGFESKISFKKDIEVSVYLRNLAEKLTEFTPELRYSAVGVLLIGDYQGKWRNFSLPGNRIYLSTGLLRQVSYESEVAAAIALELGHLLGGDVLRRVRQNLDTATPGSLGGAETRVAKQPQALEGLVLPQPAEVQSIEYFGPRGVFNFDEESHLAAAEAAVGILYRAGYDPRGLAGLWDLYSKNSSRSPYEPSTLEKLIQKTRRVIAQNAPLRNPVVRSPAFLAIQKRIKKL